MKFRDIPQFTRDGEWSSDYDLNLFVKQIDQWIKEEGLVLNPDFQRGHVWTEEQQIAYMEFLLQGGKSARIIYLNHPRWSIGEVAKPGTFVCVDGLQRITAVQRFINNEIKIFGHYFREFEDNVRATNWIKININTLPTKKHVLKWYLEINSGGVIHTEEELERVRKMLEEEK